MNGNFTGWYEGGEWHGLQRIGESTMMNLESRLTQSCSAMTRVSWLTPFRINATFKSNTKAMMASTIASWGKSVDLSSMIHAVEAANMISFCFDKTVY